MTRTRTLLCLTAALCTAAAFPQAWAQHDAKVDAGQAASATPVAMIYVASNPSNSSNNEIVAWSADANGKLTAVPGSPFQADVTSMAVNGKYLFGSQRSGLAVEAWSIGSNGSLDFATSTSIPQGNDDCASSGPIFFDHTGASLYDLIARGSGCANNNYQAFNVQKSTGKLQNLGTKAVNDWLYLPASFIGNNWFAYSASCIGNMYWGIFGFSRNSSGMLTELNIGATVPTPPSGDFYCPSQAAADPTNHVAFTMQAVDQQTFDSVGQPQIASYTAATNGHLSTTNTSASMPYTAVVSVTDLSMSPSGKLLAVSGTGGLQIFHFNGASPVTAYTGLLTTSSIDQMFWDNSNHLYAISHKAGKLYVFTITPTGYSQASGSPYTVSNPENIIVQPWPLPWK